MKAQKEILVQDLGNQNDMKIYKNFDVYRQAVIFGSPLHLISLDPQFSQKEKELHIYQKSLV